MIFTHLEIADIFEVEHEITMNNTEDFKENIEMFLMNSSECMILDLERALYLNNSALRIIACSAMAAKNNNKELVIVGIKPPLNEIFEIVKITNYMRIFKTRKEAIDYFKGDYLES